MSEDVIPQELSTREGEARRKKVKTAAEEKSLFYRALAGLKAFELVAHASADFKQNTLDKTIRHALHDIESEATAVEWTRILTEIREQKEISPVDIGDGATDYLISVEALADRFDKLYRKRKIRGRTYFELINALRNIATNPSGIAEVLDNAADRFIKIVGLIDAEYKEPTGDFVVEDEAESVGELIDSFPLITNQFLDLYNSLIASKESYETIENRLARFRGKHNYAIKRTTYRDRPKEIAKTIETEQERASKKFLAPIHMFHTQKRIPVAANDLIERFIDNWRFSDSVKAKLANAVNAAKAEYRQEVFKAHEGKSKIFEEYPTEKQSANIVPYDLLKKHIHKAMSVLPPTEKEVVDRITGKKKTVLIGGKMMSINAKEALYLLSDEAKILISQVQRIRPIPTPDSLGKEIKWFLIGDGVTGFYKNLGKLTDGEKKKIVDDENRNLINAITERGESLEKEFEVWLDHEKTVVSSEWHKTSGILKEDEIELRNIQKVLEEKKVVGVVDGKVVTRRLIAIQIPAYEQRAETLEKSIQFKRKWLKDNKEPAMTEVDIDEEKQRHIRVDAPLASYEAMLRKTLPSKIESRLEQAKLIKASTRREKELKTADLENNAVELTKARARVRAIENKERPINPWKRISSKPTKEYRVALPFVANAYIREIRKEQLTILNNALNKLNPNNPVHANTIEDIKKRIKKISSTNTKATKLDSANKIWNIYNGKLYAPKSIKSKLVKLKNMLTGPDEAALKRLIVWLDVKPPKEAPKKRSDFALPLTDGMTSAALFTGITGTIKKDVDKSGAMFFPLGRIRLVDDLKPFRENEDKIISELAYSISASVLKAGSYAEIGAERKTLQRDLRKLRKRYERRLEEADQLDPKSTNPLLALLRYRYEDKYVNSDYAKDSFGALSLMESGMLHTSKKPSDFVEEYLAMGRMLDPSNTFPEVVDKASLRTYKVLPSMKAIQYEFDNLHVHYDKEKEKTNLRDWLKGQSLETIIELQTEGLLDPYLLEIIMMNLDMEDAEAPFIQNTIRRVVAREKSKRFGGILFKRKKDRTFKLVDFFLPTKEIEDYLKADGSIGKKTIFKYPVFAALKAPHRERTKEQDKTIKMVDDLLTKQGIIPSRIMETRADLKEVLAYMAGYEKEFTSFYQSFAERQERAAETRVQREARKVGERAMREVVPKAGPYLDDLMLIAGKYRDEGTFSERTLFDTLKSIRAEIYSKGEEMTEQEGDDMRDVMSLLDGIESLARPRAFGVIKREVETMEAVVAGAQIRSLMVSIANSDRKRVERERKRLVGRYMKENTNLRAEAIALKKSVPSRLTQAEAEEMASEEIPRTIKLKDFFGEENQLARYQNFVKRMIETTKSLEYAQTFRKRTDDFYTKTILAVVRDDLIKTNPKLKKKDAIEKAKTILEKNFIPSQAHKWVPAAIYVYSNTIVQTILDSLETDYKLIAQLTGTDEDAIRQASGINEKKIRDLASWAADTERILKDRKGEKIMTFLGTPHSIAHKTITSRKTAESFFGIDKLLEDNGVSSY